MKGHIRHIPHLKPTFHGLSLVEQGHALLQRLARWHELYHQRRELASLSDATLSDLGLSRADIIKEVERPFWDDPLRK